MAFVEWELPIFENGDFEREFGVKLQKVIDIKPYRKYKCQRIRLYR